MSESIFGVDVSKHWVDVSGPGLSARVATADLGLFAARAAACGGRVVFEACGGYEAPLRQALAREGVTACRVNPARARAFARSLGRLAKTDRVDAAVLREMGQRLDLAECAPETETMIRLKALALRRRQLVEAAKCEKTQLAHTSCPDTRASAERVLAVLQQEIARMDQALASLVAATPELQTRQALLRSAPGIGPVSALALLTDLPELGSLSPREVAALAGLAPIARDSGMQTGQRHIGGGRKTLRCALYMAGMTAARTDPCLRAFATALKARGKAPKQAIIAVTRKLLIILNAMIRENRPFNAN